MNQIEKLENKIKELQAQFVNLKSDNGTYGFLADEKQWRIMLNARTKEQLVELYMQLRFDYDLLETLFVGAKKERLVSHKGLNLACEELMGDQEFESAEDKEYALCESVCAYLTMAKEELKKEVKDEKADSDYNSNL